MYTKHKICKNRLHEQNTVLKNKIYKYRIRMYIKYICTEYVKGFSIRHVPMLAIYVCFHVKKYICLSLLYNSHIIID